MKKAKRKPKKSIVFVGGVGCQMEIVGLLFVYFRRISLSILCMRLGGPL
jgi:hypothetical protein